MSERLPTPAASVVTFNARHPAFNTVRVRRALNLAVDRWSGIAALSRTTTLTAVGGILRPGAEFAETAEELATFPGFGRDVAAARREAKRLLDEAGVRNLRFRLLSLASPPYPAIGEFLIEQWRQIGVTAQLETAAPAQFAAALASGGFEAANDFNSEAADEPVLMLAKYVSRSSKNHTGATDPALDDLFEQLKKAIDPSQRHRIVLAFHQRLATGAYVMPLFWDGRIVAAAREVRGLNTAPSPAVNLDLAEAWLDR